MILWHIYILGAGFFFLMAYEYGIEESDAPFAIVIAVAAAVALIWPILIVYKFLIKPYR